jgi:hypothetical protein
MMFIFKISIFLFIGFVTAYLYNRMFQRDAKKGAVDFSAFIKRSIRRIAFVMLIFIIISMILGTKYGLLILGAFIVAHMFFLYRFSRSYF